jgi:large subunit ribosomal protein L1
VCARSRVPPAAWAWWWRAESWQRSPSVSRRCRALVEPGKAYAIDDALKILKDNSKVKFVESVDVAVRLGVDAASPTSRCAARPCCRRHRQVGARRGVLPAGRQGRRGPGRRRRRVGMDDLAEKMQAGDLNYDVVIATPDAMRVVGKLGQVLGPRGLMPNPKVGTVSPNPAEAVRNAKAGQVRYRTDKAGIIHCTIGKARLRGRRAEEQPACAAGRPAEGQAGHGQGPVPAEDLAVLDHGHRHHRRPVEPVAQGLMDFARAPGARGFILEAAAQAAAVKDRRCGQPRGTTGGSSDGRSSPSRQPGLNRREAQGPACVDGAALLEILETATTRGVATLPVTRDRPPT